MTRTGWVIALGLACSTGWPASARAALEGEWLGSFSTVRLCGSPATVTDFRLRITSAPWIKVPREQFRYSHANVTGPASITIKAGNASAPPFAISGMFLGGVVAGAPEPMLTGYFVSEQDYAVWRQRKPFSPPTGAVEARLTIHGDWASRQSLSGKLRSLTKCPGGVSAMAGQADGVSHVALDGVLTLQ